MVKLKSNRIFEQRTTLDYGIRSKKETILMETFEISILEKTFDRSIFGKTFEISILKINLQEKAYSRENEPFWHKKHIA